MVEMGLSVIVASIFANALRLLERAIRRRPDGLIKRLLLFDLWGKERDHDKQMEEISHSISQTTGRSRDDLSRESLNCLLEECEERQDAEAARLALEEYEREGGGVPWEQVNCHDGGDSPVTPQP